MEHEEEEKRMGHEEDERMEHEEERSIMPFRDDMLLAAEDVPWSWNVTTQDEVLGEGLDNWDRYAMAHLYRDDNANPETKGAYKLPIALMINNELRVVLNGVRAAMAALNGARGGVDISDEDRQAVYESILNGIPKRRDGKEQDGV